MKILLLLLSAVIAYLCGGVNGAILASRLLYHQDIRKFGSGNAGLTNFYRTFGATGALLVIAIDILKSILAVLIGGWLMSIVDAKTVGQLFAGFCLILGHMFPVFHQFRGGKGVLCGVIMAAVVDWRVGLGCFSAFLIVVILTRYVSLGSMVGAMFCPVLLWLLGYNALEGTLGLLCALLIVIKHAENILRLIGGTERKLDFSGKRKPKSPSGGS